ncbi:ABC transporter ATP-binding protein [Auritidibacter sp. NML100628]|uniref:ABC transporter ATP-binding protein n=1 Tax=Auritidibacter sp. NML100628 TaxID=2170742 RepID=UPI000D729859|nr:ABC transporter ATP-binding protein [Auritidibacter sp. NML100628]PXA76498.1 ABC transporter ATP-binding protein [Auritidibacter sp. NML100628]
MSTTDQPLLSIRNLSKKFGKTTALDGVNLELTGGRIVGLLGENGCGKTTMLKAIAGVLDGTDGDIRILGQAPGPETKAFTAFLPDVEFLSRAFTLRYCLDLYDDLFADFDRDRALEMMRNFGFSDGMKLREMSKGMREKIQIALTMSRRAKLYLLDEPISGIDPAARDEILDTVLNNLAADSLLVMSTHLIHDLEPAIDTVVFMRHGRITLTGNADDLRAEHGLSIDQLFRKVFR